MNIDFPRLSACCAMVLFSFIGYGKVELASPFSDGMVLQRDRNVPVWGWASPGEKVTVTFADQSVTSTTDANGNWRVSLKPMAASKEGRVLRANDVAISDVLVGEVWYCSGQSNAECPIVGLGPRFRDRMGATVAQMTVKPYVRYCYACDYKLSDVPCKKASYPVIWRPFTPENLSLLLRPNGSDGFSAMGVYFALDLYSALDIPIGIVGSWWGGTRIEPWTPACGYELAGVTPVPDKVHSRDIDQPCKMWNEMVEPWCPMAMRGFIWYQGCSNSTQPETYTGYMHALYKGWASKFENPDLKLYFVQLTSWGAQRVVPLQEAQSRFAAEEPNAAISVIEDSGNLSDIHPNDKLTVGRRLALHALKRDYGFDWIEDDSPVIRDWHVIGDKFVLEFDHAQSFYFYNPDRSAANGFEICGEDGVWKPAEYANGCWYTIWLGNIHDGNILGNNVVVRAPGVAHPKKLRYLHSAPWFASLYNQVNLPIGPFHIDTPNRRGRSDVVLDDEWTADGVPVTIPHCWNITDACDGKDVPKGWTGCSSANCTSYERKAVKYVRKLPDPTTGRRQFIKFEGASIKATVKVNGKPIGEHKGAFTAFAYELTEVMNPTGNEIEVVVDNIFDPDVPVIHGDFAVYGGLYRDVHFIETDRICIDSLTDGADNVFIDANPKTGEVVAKVKVLGGTNEVQRFEFKNPKLWSPETPNLYFLTIAINQGGYDAITVPFGFRTVEFKDDGFYLNGNKRVMRGVNRHQDREGKGWALSYEDHREDFELIKEMGADAVRFCHYPHSIAEYSICDELGLLVWAEVPNVDAVTFSEAFRSNLLVSARELIAQQRNHPSIFTWSIYNEIGNDFKDDIQEKTISLLTELNAYVKGLDSTRPTTAATCIFNAKYPGLNDISDILAWNLYPGWYGGAAEEMNAMMDKRFVDTKRKSLGVSEYGCGASAFQHGDAFERTKPWSKLHPDEYQARCHWGNYKQLAGRKDIWGTFVWCMFDFASDVRHEGARDGMNDKGLVEFDHKTLKSGYHFYQTNWNKTPKLYLVGCNQTETTNELVNVMGFSNVGKVKLVVNGKLVGVQDPDSVKTVVFRDVPLLPGKNTIELESKGMKTSATWNRHVSFPALPPLPGDTIVDFSKTDGWRPDFGKFVDDDDRKMQLVRKEDGLHYVVDHSRDDGRRYGSIIASGKDALVFTATNRTIRLIFKAPHRSPLGRNFSLKFVDSQGEFFQYRPLSVECIGDVTLMEFFVAEGKHSGVTWGGKNQNAKWDGAIRLCEINFSWTSVAKGEVVFERISEVVTPLRSVNTVEPLCGFVKGHDMFYGHGLEVSITNGLLLVSMDKGNGWISMNHNCPGPSRILGPYEIVLRLSDAVPGGKVGFSLRNEDTKKSEKITQPWTKEIRFRFDKPLDTAWYFSAMEFHVPKEHLPRNFSVVAIDILRNETQAGAIRLDVDTGNALHLVRDGRNPWAVLSNPSSSPLTVKGILRIKDYFGESYKLPLDACVPAKGTHRILLNYPETYGTFRLDAEIVGDDGSRSTSWTTFARFPQRSITEQWSRDEFRFGVNFHITRYPEIDRKLCEEMMVAMGCKLSRSDIMNFGYVCPKEGEYRWERDDELLKELEDHGISLDAIIYTCPYWARAFDKQNKESDKLPRTYCLPCRPGLFQEYCKRLAERYGTRVAYYEIGNEWDLTSPDVLSIEDGIAMQREAMRGLHAGCNDVVCIPNGWACPLESRHKGMRKDFQRRMMGDAQDAYDVYAIHLHGSYANYARNMRDIFKFMKEVGIKKPWYSNETALTSHNGTDDEVPICVWQKILFAWSHGSTDYIWYNLRATGYDPKDGEMGYGLMTADYHPRTGMAAFSAVSDIFGKLRFQELLSDTEYRLIGVWKGERDGVRRTVVAGWDSAAQQSMPIRVSTDAKRAFIVDLMGNARKIDINSNKVIWPIGSIPSAVIFEEADEVRADPNDVAAIAIPEVRKFVARPDGWTDEWVCDRYSQVKEIYQADPANVDRTWKGTEDLSAKISFSKGSGSLNVMADVIDDVRATGDRLVISLRIPGKGITDVLIPGDKRAIVDVKHESKVSRYSVKLPYDSFGINDQSLATGIRVHARIEDDDGKGLDGWIEYLPGVTERNDSTLWPMIQFQ